ncbi:MAG: DNA-deoxyinosine glycosylase [Acutalibacteraceae bacterium]
MDYDTIIHPLEPVYSDDSRILILGTMPSPKSRENGFYYSHPQNRFWRVLANIFKEDAPCTINEKTDFLHRHRIAVWDVLKSCEIKGAADSSIKNAVPNDIRPIIDKSNIKFIFTTGATAYNLYNRLCKQSVGIDATPLPSTSPANARMSFEALTEIYKQSILPCL